MRPIEDYQRYLGLYRATGDHRGYLQRFERIDEREPEFAHERVIWLDYGRRYPEGTVGWIVYYVERARGWHVFYPIDDGRAGDAPA